jgi:hypothetical protein
MRQVKMEGIKGRLKEGCLVPTLKLCPHVAHTHTFKPRMGPTAAFSVGLEFWLNEPSSSIVLVKQFNACYQRQRHHHHFIMWMNPRSSIRLSVDDFLNRDTPQVRQSGLTS